jgi:hypothetical protein
MTRPDLASIAGGEHFCTMFDANFLPMGLALYESLTRQHPNAVLWVLCLDHDTSRALDTLKLPRLRLIALEDIETDVLRAASANRTRREYYWTMTPWMFDAVFDRAPDARRVTYLDADLYFFRSPSILLDMMSDRHEVLITHHAFAPQYDYAATSGPFCVQFICVKRMDTARGVIAWWRDRCLEWCYARVEPDRFGDQRYLEQWPKMLGDRLLIVDRADWTGAPWNACLAEQRDGPDWTPVFYHFHGFRYLSGDRALLLPTMPEYEIGSKGWPLYRAYVRATRRASRMLRRAGVGISGVATPPGFEDYDPWPTVLRRFARLVRRRLQPITRRPIVSIR